MTENRRILKWCYIGLLICVSLNTLHGRDTFNRDNCHTVNRQASIDPDYSGTVIPPNIAPLNFIINEPAIRYRVIISSSEGDQINLSSKNPGIIIPEKSWKKLLQSNTGQKLFFHICIKDRNNQWTEFDPIINQIAEEPIDSYLVYRLIQPMYFYFNKMGLYQRNLENYEEKPVFLNRSTPGSCMNCHAFCNNNPEKMMFHVRGADAGTIIVNSDEILKINTATDFNPAAAVYPAWHPDGTCIAFSINQLRQFFHTTGTSQEVLDNASDLILYCTDSNTITTSPSISDPDRLETFPAWSPDGTQLYFSTAPKFKSVKDYRDIRYDLARIFYNHEDNTWGSPETLLSAKETGLSMLLPRVSPDGQYLLFCGAHHGNFPVYLESSDLYIMNLTTRKYIKLDEVNSNRSDSFHSWSSNSRWFVFSSKRRDNLCARPYFSYVDKNGKAQKPFLMPQKNPDFYASFLKTYNLPELIRTPIQIKLPEMAKVILNDHNTLNVRLDPNVTIPKRPDNTATEGQMAPQ